MGRYIQGDPVGLIGGLNPYVYAKGNPFLYVDPNGKTPVHAGLAIGGALIGAISGAITSLQKCASWKDVAIAAAVGGVAGAAAGVTLGAAGAVGVGIVSGAAGDAIGTQISGGDFNVGDTVMAGVFGGLGGAFGAGLGKIGIKANIQTASGGITTTAAQLQFGASTGASACGCKGK